VLSLIFIILAILKVNDNKVSFLVKLTLLKGTFLVADSLDIIAIINII
jgi:hypothetical protein